MERSLGGVKVIARATSGIELHSKFVQEDGAFTLDYGGIGVFFSGLEGLVGSPHPQLVQGIKSEHCLAPDSNVPVGKRDPNHFETPT